MTPQQLRTLDFIREQIHSTGVAPSYAEMAAQLGIASRGQVANMVIALERAGHIHIAPKRRRGITLAGAPDLKTVPTEMLRAELARREARP